MSTNRRKNPAARRSANMALALMGAGLLVVLTALYLVFQGANAAGPRLAVDKNEIDFGKVKLGETVTARFVLTNTGDAPLRFNEPPYIEIKEGC